MQKPKAKELRKDKIMALLVNGERIEDLVIQKEIERLRPDYERVFADQSPEQQKTQLLDWSKENVIEMVLLKQEAEKNYTDIPESKIESVLTELKKEYKSQAQPSRELSMEDENNLKKSIGAQIKIEQILRDTCKNLPKPSEEDVRKFYEENKEEFKSAEQIRVSHIVKHINWQTEEEAAYKLIKQALDELKKGAIFETIVTKYSDCPDKGGDLGYITRGRMVEEFDDVVFNLGIGQASDIFRTRFGFHIAKVYDRKQAAIYELEEVNSRIADRLKEQRRREAIDKFVDQLKSRANIKEI